MLNSELLRIMISCC